MFASVDMGVGERLGFGEGVVCMGERLGVGWGYGCVMECFEQS